MCILDATGDRNPRADKSSDLVFLHKSSPPPTQVRTREGQRQFHTRVLHLSCIRDMCQWRANICGRSECLAVEAVW